MNAVLATAVIQFVGLCMFKYAEPPATGVEVILPRVEQSAQPRYDTPLQITHPEIHLVQSRPRERFPVTPLPNYAPMPMDGHTAIIAFMETARDPSSTWTSKKLKPVPQYQYVELQGEQLRFIANGRNRLAGIPPELPQVTNNCKSRKLRTNYKQLAASIVKIEAGLLTACTPKVNGEQYSRVDTRLTYEHKGPIIIETTDGSKRLVLDPENIVIIGNVPTAWINSEPGVELRLLGEEHHYEAYVSMLDDTKGNCTQQFVSGLPTCDGEQPGFGPRERRAGPPPVFGQQQKIRREGVSDPTPKPPGDPCPNCFVTYACSNSQYP